ncbi:MAG: hypothetical protein ACLUIW_08010 [Dysosmobacter welbionis]
MSINELEMKCRELRQLQAPIDEAQAEAETTQGRYQGRYGDTGSRDRRRVQDHLEARHYVQAGYCGA